MEHKDKSISTIFCENAWVNDIYLETETTTTRNDQSFYFADNVTKYHDPIRHRYTLSFETPDQIIFENPIRMSRGKQYEVLILIREKNES